MYTSVNLEKTYYHHNRILFFIYNFLLINDNLFPNLVKYLACHQTFQKLNRKENQNLIRIAIF